MKAALLCCQDEKIPDFLRNEEKCLIRKSTPGPPLFLQTAILSLAMRRCRPVIPLSTVRMAFAS